MPIDRSEAACYLTSMIGGFADKGLERFWTTGSKSGINPAHADRLRIRLKVLSRARTIDDVDVAGFDLHQWEGPNAPWSIRLSGSWRLLFQWGEDNHAYDIRTWQGHRGRGRR
jgi:proteic killer suppression protein